MIAGAHEGNKISFTLYKSVFSALSIQAKAILVGAAKCSACKKSLLLSGRGCTCRKKREEWISRYVYEYEFGNEADALNLGTYLIRSTVFDACKAQIKKDRRRRWSSKRETIGAGRVEQLESRYKLNATAAVKAWLVDHADVVISIKKVPVKCIPPPLKHQKKLVEVFRSCFEGKTSKQHGYLKWFIWNRLIQSVNKEEFRHEALRTIIRDNYGYFFERDVYIPSRGLARNLVEGKILPPYH